MGTATAVQRSWDAGRSLRAVLSVLAALIGMMTVADSLRTLHISADTTNLVLVVDRALVHIRHGELLHWGGYYALLQAIPVFSLRAAGVSAAHVIDGLVGLNVLSFAVMLGISWWGPGRGSRAGGLLLLVVLLSSTLLWYLHSSFGEPLAAAVTLAAVAACWNQRGHIAAAVFLFLAGLSKDTAVPLLLPLCLGASIGGTDWADRTWRWRRVASLAIAAVASLLVTAAYDYARFGSVLDTPYLSPLLYVPWLSTQLSFFAAIWLSPNGGLLLFWPSFGLLLAASTLASLHACRSSAGWRARLQRAMPAVGVAGSLFAMTLELSRWVAPLGWAAWGPRLLLPWLPACAYLLVAAYGGELERLLNWLLRPAWRFWATAAALAVASFPQYVTMVRPMLYWEALGPDRVCPVIALVENGQGSYYHCTNHELWTKGSMLLSAFQPADGPAPVLIGVACAAALVWLLLLLRRASAGPRPGAW